MPHDKNGKPLKAGDKVIIRATISTVSEGDAYCNLTLATDEPMYPGTSKTGLNLNAKQVELATPPDTPPAEAAAANESPATAA